MASIDPYHALCERFAHLRCDDNIFVNAKKRFKSDINSSRRYESIKTFKELLVVLEKRDILNRDNIVSLEGIAATIDDAQLRDLVKNYSRDHAFSTSTSPSTINPVVREPPCSNLVLPDRVPSDPLHRVYALIANDIGSRWRELARALRIGEGEIDQLECRHRKIADRVYEILTYKESATPQRQWKTVLCEALNEARRNDLRLEVQGIFDTM